jgi:hypothetical protein
VHQTEFDLKQSGGLKPCYIPTDMKLTDGFWLIFRNAYKESGNNIQFLNIKGKARYLLSFRLAFLENIIENIKRLEEMIKMCVDKNCCTFPSINKWRWVIASHPSL